MTPSEQKPQLKYYLAGPMTGYPQFNFPLFHSAAADLRGAGYIIISPAENDTPAVQVAAMASTDGTLDAKGEIAGETWGQILARDVTLVADIVDGIIFLPDWANSRGARLEAFTGLLCSKKFGYYAPALSGRVAWTSAEAISAGIKGKMP